MTRVVDITGGKAIAELENARNKMKLKDEAKDSQQGPAITKDTLAATVGKAVTDALRKQKGIFPLTLLERTVTDSSCVTFSNEGKSQKASQNRQEKAQLTFCQEKPKRGWQKEKGKRCRYRSDEGEEAQESDNDSEGTWTWSNP